MLIPHGKKYSIANVVEGSFHFTVKKQVYLNCRETGGILWWAFHSFLPIAESTESTSNAKAAKVLSATSEARGFLAPQIIPSSSDLPLFPEA